MIIVCNKKAMVPMKNIHPGQVFRYNEKYYVKIANTNFGIEKERAVDLLDGFIYDESFFDSDVYKVDAELHTTDNPRDNRTVKTNTKDNRTIKTNSDLKENFHLGGNKMKNVYMVTSGTKGGDDYSVEGVFTNMNAAKKILCNK